MQPVEVPRERMTGALVELRELPNQAVRVELAPVLQFGELARKRPNAPRIQAILECGGMVARRLCPPTSRSYDVDACRIWRRDMSCSGAGEIPEIQ